MITIDYQNRMPIYEQIVERFQTLIVNGALEPDTQLPSVRNLAVDLAINPNTIQKAYAVLEQQGFLYPVKGRGNFVSGDSEVKNRKIQAFYRTLKNVVIQVKELGVTRDEFLEKSKEMFEEGQYDRN